MNVIVTGMHGTVAPALARYITEQGHTVIPWDRELVPVDDEHTIRAFLHEQQPDGVAHLATGSPVWAEMIARCCAEAQIKLVFTSSVSVFGPHQSAPLTVEVMPEPNDDYGRYKQECEQRVQAANPDAVIARLGWQIGDAPGSNTMVDYLDRLVHTEGHIAASRNWYPACSLLADTAVSLYHLLVNATGAVYHLDGNPGLSMYEIALRLKTVQQRNWPIIATDTPVFDNRMRDDRIVVSPITARLHT